MRLFLVLVAVSALFAVSPAVAADLPTLPGDPTAQATAPDWKGFYIGSGVSLYGMKGAKGQVGGEVFAGYDKHFDNNVVLGVRFDTGYAPFMIPGGRYQGFDYAMTSVKLGYEMGRFTPFVTAGVGAAKASNFGAGLPNAANSVNGLFYGPGAVQPVTSVGAGFDYAITNNLHVGAAAYINNAAGALTR